jgi:hypothetical protein
MTAYFTIEPEVAGGFGPHTILDRRVHPPIVSKLHHQFDGWLGDQILESFPCFLVTESLLKDLESKNMTGIESADVEISVGPEFDESSVVKQLPKFMWLKVSGGAGQDDFGIGPEFRLVVSARALQVIQSTGPRALRIEPIGP